MQMALTEGQKAAWRKFADSARRLGLPSLAIPPDPRSEEDLANAISQARASVEHTAREVERELSEATQPQAAAADDAAWKRLEEACRKLEQDLRSAPTLRARLDEGRRSMMPKVERLVYRRLQPVVRTEGRKVVATVSEDGLTALREELPQWVQGWSQYAFGWLELDLRREVEVAWSRRDGEMPIPPPNFRPLQLPEITSELTFPEVTIHRDAGGFAGTVLRNARSVLYGVLSLTFLFGISRASIPVWVYGVGFLAACAVGMGMASGERREERKKLEAEIRQKAEQATWDASRTWLDRMADKLAESAREQLHNRRFELVEWWRREVEPQQKQAEKAAGAARARADQLRMQVPRLQDAKRNLPGLISALDAVAAEKM
jgi:hypothetical protein